MSDASDLFKLSDWQVSVEARRELGHQIVVACVSGDKGIEQLISEWKRKVSWGFLDSRAQNIANVMFSSLRLIVREWNNIPERDRATFLTGYVPYSRLVKVIREEIL